MEFLGHCSTRVRRDNESGKWKPINLVFTDVESYCEATSRLIDRFKDDCRMVIVDRDGERHFVNILDYRYKTEENTITVFPENCKQISSYERKK